jgi:hypothetical protein
VLERNFMDYYENEKSSGEKSEKRFYYLLLIIVVLGYIVTFTKVLIRYHR